MSDQKYGATVHDDGISFRVWAPSAESVGVKGDFTGWTETVIPLQSQPDGSWYADVPSAKIGQEYKYSITYKGQTFERNDPRALQLTSSGDTTIIVDPEFNWGEDTFEMVPREKLVIYELHVGTFVRHDEALAGTFDDAATKLDYLAHLGINAIEVMPCNAAWMDRWWGYTPTNIYAVEASYGGRKAFQEFVRAAHRKGIAIILDVVYNHLNKDAGLDLWQFDGWQENDKGGIYFYNDDRSWTPWGETRPDYSRPEVRRYITDNVRMWFEDFHVDGLRVDSVVHIRNVQGKNNDSEHDIADGWKLLQEINTEAHSCKTNALVIAEDLQGNEAITHEIDSGGAGFDSQWEPMFEGILREELDPADDAARHMDKIRYALTHVMNSDAFARVIYSESHDADANGHSRFGEEVTPGNAGSYLARKRTALAAALIMTAPGTPMLFQGQEFQEGGAFSHWAPLNWRNVETYAGIVDLYSHLIALRQNRHGNTAGLLGRHVDVFLQEDETKVIGFHRWDKAGAGDDVVVVANFANKKQEALEIAFPYVGTWRVRLNSDWSGYSSDFSDVGPETVEVEPSQGDSRRLVGKLDIGPYAVLILSSDK